MQYSRYLPGGWLQALSVITGLTRLVLASAGDGHSLGDDAAAALARSCRQLRHLDLNECNLGSGAWLDEVRRLTQLTQLQLQGNAGVTRQGLMQLTGLRQLQQLGVDTWGCQGGVTRADVREFWRALTGSTSGEWGCGAVKDNGGRQWTRLNKKKRRG
uniref:Receptor-type protein kinase n=1 Tax=Tetradesmus obliquus TaxID=3088 RepID=A0A383WJR7_TETOB|eukprot:jgi/Sobl393_1/10353/SZX77710.1